MCRRGLYDLAAIFLLCVASANGYYLGDRDAGGLELGRYSVWYHRLKRSTAEDEGAASVNHSLTNSSHSGHNERYQLASINWRRVENPFIVCVWILFAGLAKIGFRSKYMHKIVSRVPESCLLICLGLIVGGIAYAINPQHQISKLLFNPDTFFLFILPPIVLEAGYFMEKEPFFDNCGSILLYAIIGTLFNAFAIGLSLYGVYSAGWMPGMHEMELNILQCLLFGSIISAVDPVAVISVFEEIHVNVVLYICVFGESLLNDGVAVVLYHLFEQYLELSEVIVIDYVMAFLSFFVVVGGGFTIGLIYGFFGSFITKYTVNNRVIEPTFVFVTCYLSYLTAEIFHLSGIIAIVFAGFTMNSYVEHNISEKSHTTVKYGMKMLANICETIIFMLLGISAVSDFWQHWNTGFVLWTLVFITAYRAIGVVVLTFILNKFRLDKINGVDQFVMAYGGLRGAIAFSLVSLTSPEIVPAIKTMICACIVCILFTSFVQGSTIRPIVEFLQVKTANDHNVSMFEDINMRLIDHLMAGIEDCIGHRGHHYWTQRLMKFNTEYLMKWFVREPLKTPDYGIIDKFHRLNAKETRDMLLEMERGSFNELTSEKTVANLLMPEIRRTYSTASFSSIMMRTPSEACIDLRAFDMQRQPEAAFQRDKELGDAHHMLKENMYRPRVRLETRYRRGEIDVSQPHRRQEREILMRRKFPRKKSHKNRRHPRHSASRTFGLHSQKSRNGSYITTPQQPSKPSVRFAIGDEPVCAIKQTINPLTGVVAPSVMIEGCSRDNSGSATPVIVEQEDEGITFSVKKENEFKVKSEETKDTDSVDGVKPVALEQELPWKTATVAICDPRERRGSAHPHYYPESDEDDEDHSSQPGPSLNSNNNNSNTNDEDNAAVKHPTKSDSESGSDKTQLYLSPQTTENAESPLMIQQSNLFEVYETLPEDTV